VDIFNKQSDKVKTSHNTDKTIKRKQTLYTKPNRLIHKVIHSAMFYRAYFFKNLHR